MNDRDPLTRLLGTPGEDAGCEGGMALLAMYVEDELAGRNVRDLFPTVAEHLRNCPACEFLLDIHGEQRHPALAAGVLARSAEQPCERIAIVHLSSGFRCPSCSRRRRSFRRASWSTL